MGPRLRVDDEQALAFPVTVNMLKRLDRAAIPRCLPRPATLSFVSAIPQLRCFGLAPLPCTLGACTDPHAPHVPPRN